MVRRGLRQLVDEAPDLAVCGEAENAAAARSLLDASAPDLVLMDLALEDINGIDLLKQLRVQHPDLSVLILSMLDEALYAERALAAGARGYIMKRTSDEELLGAIRRVLSGRIYVSEAVRERLLPVHNDNGGEPSEAPDPIAQLSDRELEVFLMLGQGYAPRHIADRLHVSVKTVETHRRHLKQKLNLESAALLTRYAIQWCNDHDAGGVRQDRTE